MSELIVTVTAADGTRRQHTIPVEIWRGLYPGSSTYPGPTTYPGKG